MFFLIRENTLALAAIQASEKCNSEATLKLQHSSLFAKVILFAKESQLEDCETSLKALLKCSSTPFQTTLVAVKHFFNKLVDCEKDSMSKIAEIYKMLAGRFAKYANDFIYMIFKN